MGLRYRQSIFDKNRIGLEDPVDALESATYTPSVDFTQETLGQQAPKSFQEKLGVTPKIDFTKSTLAEQSPEAATVGGEEVKTPDTSGIDYKQAGLAGAQTLARGGKPIDAASSALMATGTPVGIGAGLALQTYSTIQGKKQAERDQRYKEKVAEAEARRSALNRLAQIGQSLKA